MDATLQEHDAKVVYHLPPGLKELCADITREVLRNQPENLYAFIAEYLNAMLMTQDRAEAASQLIHGMLTNDVTYEAMLERRGVSAPLANAAAIVVQAAYRGYLARKYVKTMRDNEGTVLDVYLDSLGVSKDVASLRAIKIQAAFRGHLAREALKLTFYHDEYVEPENRGDIDTNILAKVLESLGVTLEEATNAAIIIQRRYRQYRMAKSSKKLSSATRQLLAKNVREAKASQVNMLPAKKLVFHGTRESATDIVAEPDESKMEQLPYEPSASVNMSNYPASRPDTASSITTDVSTADATAELSTVTTVSQEVTDTSGVESDA